MYFIQLINSNQHLCKGSLSKIRYPKIQKLNRSKHEDEQNKAANIESSERKNMKRNRNEHKAANSRNQRVSIQSG